MIGKKIWAMQTEDLQKLFEAEKTKTAMLEYYYKDKNEWFEIHYLFGLGTYTMEVWIFGQACS
jgi:hypothetical protein